MAKKECFYLFFVAKFQLKGYLLTVVKSECFCL